MKTPHGHIVYSFCYAEDTEVRYLPTVVKLKWLLLHRLYSAYLKNARQKDEYLMQKNQENIK